jgi:DNA-binding MarR family transcriptional regulator
MNNNQDEFIGKWLGLAHLKLFNLLTKMLHKEGFDLTFEQLILLKIINANEGVSQQELASIMNKDKTSITRAISILENHHKVVRISSRDDKRKKGLFLTKEGKEHLALIMPRFIEIKNEIEKGFDKQDLDQAIVTIKKIVERTNQLEKQL